jgi:hypothetical protein
METIAILEFLGRHGEIIRTERISHFPVTLGQSYDNDVIINDPYLTAQHIRIEMDEKGFKAVDLGSKNGMHIIRTKSRQDEIRLDGDTVLRLGHTQIRLRSRDYVTHPEQLLSPDRAFRHPLVFALALAVLLAMICLVDYLTITQALDFKQLGASFALTVGMLLVWVSIWSGIGKLVCGKWLFFLHGSLACLGLIFGWLATGSVSLGAFAFSWAALAKYSALPLALVLGFTIYHHISLMSRAPGIYRLISAFLLTLVLFAGNWGWNEAAHKDDWGMIKQYVDLWPVAMLGDKR